ncbi:MAG: DUF2007 domain-containing protein [Gammaproteobacteria bacterium]|nr:DUF2007 domain-containing protein [Gammaproteobacteria bacterium]
MKRVLMHPDLVQVGHLRAVLEGNGIACLVKNELLGGGAGDLPLNECWPEIWVLDERDETIARTLVEQFMYPGVQENLASWTCTECGEAIEGQFGECWQCAGSGGGVFEA